MGGAPGQAGCGFPGLEAALGSLPSPSLGNIFATGPAKWKYVIYRVLTGASKAWMRKDAFGTELMASECGLSGEGGAWMAEEDSHCRVGAHIY